VLPAPVAAKLLWCKPDRPDNAVRNLANPKLYVDEPLELVKQ